MPQRTWPECSFLIPLRRDAEISDGKPHPIEAYDWLDEALAHEFEGWTKAPGHYQGAWKSSLTGKLIRDRSQRYVVALPKKKLAALRQLLREACKKFRQQRIYLSIAGQVELIEGEDDSSEDLP